MLSVSVDSASVSMLRVPVVYLWMASIVIIRFMVDNDERFDCSIGQARLDYSFGAVDLSVFAVEAVFTLDRSTQIERSSRKRKS